MTDIDIAAARALCTGVNATEKRMVGQVVGALGVHRWKSMGVGTVECECGAVVTGEWPHDSDEAFRWHLAHVVLDSLPFIAAARDLVPALLAEVERLRGEHIGLGWFCRECRLWIKPWEQGDPPLSMTCPQCDNRAFTWTGAQVERDEARAEVERLQRIISEHSCSPRDALDMD
jgi:hypothetical protein